MAPADLVLVTYLIAVSSTPDADVAFDFAKDTLIATRDTAILVSVVKQKADMDAATVLLKQRAAEFAARQIKARIFCLVGKAGDLIVDLAANMHADIIVMGARKQRTVKRMVMGSVSTHVVRHAHCSVLVVKGRTPMARSLAELSTPCPDSLVGRLVGSRGRANSAASDQGPVWRLRFLLAMDLSRFANYAFNLTVTSLARPGDAAHTFFIHNPARLTPAVASERTKRAERQLLTYQGIASAYGLSYKSTMLTETRDVRLAVRSFAESHNPCVLVLGHRGLTRMAELKSSSVSIHALHEAAVDAVLIAREQPVKESQLNGLNLLLLTERRRARVSVLNEELNADLGGEALPAPKRRTGDRRAVRFADADGHEAHSHHGEGRHSPPPAEPLPAVFASAAEFEAVLDGEPDGSANGLAGAPALSFSDDGDVNVSAGAGVGAGGAGTHAALPAAAASAASAAAADGDDDDDDDDGSDDDDDDMYDDDDDNHDADGMGENQLGIKMQPATFLTTGARVLLPSRSPSMSYSSFDAEDLTAGATCAASAALSPSLAPGTRAGRISSTSISFSISSDDECE